MKKIKMKKITQLLTIMSVILIINSTNATEYYVTLSDKHYKDSISIKPLEKAEEEIVVSPASSVEVDGWNMVLKYGQEPIMTDLEWTQAVSNMKTGIKIVSGTSYAFISKSKLENANCLNINQSSIRNNTYVHGNTLFHHEISGCNGAGLDYSLLYFSDYDILYNNSGYWDIVVGNVNTGLALVYIY